MFGPFRPSSSLSGGLLWKIPWRLSAPQKQRQRRRLRRVDNVVAVLDTALKRQQQQAATLSSSTNPTAAEPEPSSTSASVPQTSRAEEDFAQTAEGQRLLQSQTRSAENALRHGRGPRQGEILPDGTRTGDEARRLGTIKLIERWKVDMPTEQEMLPRDKYTMFDSKVRGYRKGVHKLPKWTRVSQRLNPPGF